MNDTTGALQGLDKRETAEKHGAQQVLEWRRGFSVRPPELSYDHPSHPRNDPRYSEVPNLPGAESLADTLVRVRAWWEEVLVPLLRSDQCVLVVAHGNSLRALVKLFPGTVPARCPRKKFWNSISLQGFQWCIG